MGTIVHTGWSSGGRPPGAPDPVVAAGRSEAAPLLEGDRGTVQTIQLVRRAVRESLVDPYVRAALARILQGVPPHNDYAEARAIFNWVLRNIRFTKDPVDHETVSDAKWTLIHRIGDCDDINGVLLPALLMAAGHRVRLVTVSNQPAAPEAFSHIYAEVQIQGAWIPVDAARDGARFGRGPTRYFRKRVWSLTENRHQDVGGLSGTRVQMGQDVNWSTKLQDLLRSGTEQYKEILAARAAASGTVIPTTTIAIPTAPTTDVTPTASSFMETAEGMGVTPNVLVMSVMGIAALMIYKMVK